MLSDKLLEVELGDGVHATEADIAVAEAVVDRLKHVIVFQHDLPKALLIIGLAYKLK